jgi:hypothetical protein
MPFKLIFIGLVAFAAYLLGAKAGRERYTEIMDAITKRWNDPSMAKARAKAKKAR